MTDIIYYMVVKGTDMTYCDLYTMWMSGW